MTKKKTETVKRYKVLKPLTDGKSGSYEPGQVLTHADLAAYVSEQNITALIKGDVIKEVTE